MWITPTRAAKEPHGWAPQLVIQQAEKNMGAPPARRSRIEIDSTVSRKTVDRTIYAIGALRLTRDDISPLALRDYLLGKPS